MQFSCDSCKTQLQIADEKVRGKRLVVRCRRCGAKITIADPALAGKLTKPSPAGPKAAVPPAAAAPPPAAAPKATPAAQAKPADGWAPKTSPAPAAPAPSKQPSSQQAPSKQASSQQAPSQPKRTTDTENTLAMDSAMLERALLASKEEDPEIGSTRPPAPDVAAPADPPLWFAMLQGKQVGPLGRSDVEARVFAGEVGPRTYLWKEGMDAWQRAKEVPELSSLFPPPPEEPKPAPAVPATPAPAAEEPADRSQERVEGGVPDELFTPGATHSNSDLASWANTDLGRQTNPVAEPGLQLAQPPQQRARPSTPMFESATPPRSRGGFGIVILAILAAVAVGGWVFFGQERRQHAQAAAAESTADAATAETAPSSSDAAVAEAAPVPEKPAPKATGLTADQVRKKLDDNKPALQTCVDDALKRDPKLRAGKIHVVATIAPSGQVTGVKIDKRSIDEAPLGACLKRTTRKIAFPSFEGDPFDVDIPIVVTAGE